MIGTLVQQARVSLARERLGECLRAEAVETFLELLLTFLRFGVALDPGLRRSVAGFTADYRMATRDGRVDVGLSFRDGALDVHEDPAGPFDATLRFRDERALMRYFSSTDPDLLAALLKQDVVIEGNLNYVYRLAYLARHIQLEALGRV